MVAAVGVLGRIISHDLWQIYRAHDAVALRIHAYAVDLVNVEHGDIEGILLGKGDAGALHNALSYRVVLVFYRPVDPAVVAVVGNAAEVTGKPCHGADNVSVKIRLYKNGSKGIVYVLMLVVHGNALNVPGGNFRTVYYVRQRRNGIFR